MPRQSRIDAPGALHHIIARGIGRRNIYNYNQNRDNFVDRLETVLEQTRTGFYAWALIPNHFDVANLLNIDVKLVWSPGKNLLIVKARSLLCYCSVRELGISLSQLSRQPGLSVTAIGQSVERGKRIAIGENFELEVQNLKR